MKKRLGWILGAVVVLYGLASAALYSAMRLPPERFGAIMAHVPLPAMVVLPFQPLWMARRGRTLQPGDVAPDFTLPTVDGSRTVHLYEELRREQPVVLIFGSYT